MLRPSRRAGVVALLLVVLVLQPAMAAPGDLDTTFGGDGKVVTAFTRAWDAAFKVALQDNGRIVAAGQASGKGGRFALVRYMPDGSRDTSFGGNGKVATNFSPWYDAAWGLAIQSDGKIVAAGDANYEKNSMFALARYKPNGKLDKTFGKNGKVTTQFTKKADPVGSMLLQPNGRILVAGAAGFVLGRSGKLAVARYRPNGRLDRSFGGNGKVKIAVAPKISYANSLALQPDGKILVGGWSVASGSQSKISVVRLHPNGKLDESFSGDGKAITDFPGSDESARGLAVQPDGAIVVAGATGESTADQAFALIRYAPDGTLDPTFGGGDGKVVSQPTTGRDGPWDMALQDDGKILVVGEAGGAGGRFALGRYETDGSLDAGFGAGGWVLTNFSSRLDMGWDLAIQEDGNIVVVGGMRMDHRKQNFALARYLTS